MHRMYHKCDKMNKTMIGIAKATLLAISLFAGTLLNAQTATLEGKTTLSIETDPSTFLFNGYGFHVRLKPKDSRHWLAGAGSYALDLPAFLVNLNADNKDKGWKVRINSAYSLFGEYYFSEANQKWFAGLQVGIQNYKNTNADVPGESKYANLLIMPSIGYNWQPFKFPIYIKPWFGLGYTSKISGGNAINNLNYDASPIVPFLTMHLGYTL